MCVRTPTRILCVYVYVPVFFRLHTHVYVCVHMCTCVRTYVCVRMYPRVCACVHTDESPSLYVNETGVQPPAKGVYKVRH